MREGQHLRRFSWSHPSHWRIAWWDGWNMIESGFWMVLAPFLACFGGPHLLTRAENQLILRETRLNWIAGLWGSALAFVAMWISRWAARGCTETLSRQLRASLQVWSWWKCRVLGWTIYLRGLLPRTFGGWAR